MKVLMIVRELGYSGAFKMFSWLANALSDSGHDVTVCTWIGGNVELHDENIRRINLDLSSTGFFGVCRAIRSVVKQVNADVCISFLLDANVYNTIACIGRRTKSVICERNDPFKPRYYKLKFWKPLFRFADGAVFQLEEVASFYSNIKGITAVIPNPVICNSSVMLNSIQQRPNEINVLGRLDIFQKRHDIMIRAFAEFLHQYPSYILCFYGDGPDKGKMIPLIQELGIQDRVFFKGITYKPQEVMANGKFFVLTSDFEGIPNSLIEAMSIGMPCIVTDCRPGGARSLIEDGKNGFIVNKGDYHAIASKMKWMITHPQKADAIGQCAKEICNKFSEDKIVNLWNDFLNRLIGLDSKKSYE